MFKMLTGSITLLGLNFEYVPPVDPNPPIKLIAPISPTLDLDPWESYRNKKNQEISDMILEKEIKECLD